MILALSVAMDGDTLVETVTGDRATELDRLGSEKSLVATTAARLDRASVLAAADAAERRAAETFAAWAADESDDAARAAFERVAAQERDHAERVADLLTGTLPSTTRRPTPCTSTSVASIRRPSGWRRDSSRAHW
ncbi:hypothetical protein ACFQL0_05665 [Haloplanus litoreus]|uniref:hypothetical protein n=1 Tax=Haloplanus litoreus TaxID=767515 RepID=UPI003613AC97